MVSLPSFDPNNISSADPDTFRNRALTDQFEPGSILKPIVTAIALDAGVLNQSEKIFCENGNYRGKGFGRIGEFNYHKYGNLTAREILIKSSNIGMAKIGQRLGKKRLYKGLTLFGFGRKSGLDLPGEAHGLLRTTDKWTGYSVTRIPFGQEISATAIQIIRAFCILANGGRSVCPFLVKAIVDNDGCIIELKQPPPSVGFVISPEVAKWVVTDPMVGVVNEKQNGGTGWRAKLEKWQVFGKTGTADIAKADERGYSDDATIASFIAGAPAEEPAVLVLVSIRKPNRKLGKGHTGGAVASPVAAKILEKTLSYLEKHQL
jgi:cell division protein FtsI/penicillin-binding protein 2